MAREMVRAIFLMATRNDFERADIEKLELMMKTLIQRWLRQDDVEHEVIQIPTPSFAANYSCLCIK